MALTAAAALAAAGCGGGGRLSHDAYVRHADAICSAYDAKVELLARPTSYDQILAYVRTTLPLYVAALDKLKALKAPSDDETAVQDWLARDRQVVTAVKNLRAAAMRHDLASTNEASTALQAASLAARRAATALGMQTCSTP